MINREVFHNAPIVEALLDIHVELPQKVDLYSLEKFNESIQQTYPNKRQRVAFQSEIKFNAGEPPQVSSPSSDPDGYIFESPEGKKVVQARLNGFTFNKLKPYDSWEIFCEESRKLWELYVDIAKPSAVTRIGLRYINRIEIPLPINDFKEYVLTVPEIAPGIPPGLSSFFMRLVIPNPENNSIALITETIEPVIDGKILPFILDIDVFKEGKFNVNSDLWLVVEELYHYKNTVFFRSITDKARELFI